MFLGKVGAVTGAKEAKEGAEKDGEEAKGEAEKEKEEGASAGGLSYLTSAFR